MHSNEHLEVSVDDLDVYIRTNTLKCGRRVEKLHLKMADVVFAYWSIVPAYCTRDKVRCFARCQTKATIHV